MSEYDVYIFVLTCISVMIKRLFLTQIYLNLPVVDSVIAVTD